MKEAIFRIVVVRLMLERVYVYLFYAIFPKLTFFHLQKTLDLGSIPGRVKPKTIKISINSFPF